MIGVWFLIVLVIVREWSFENRNSKGVSLELLIHTHRWRGEWVVWKKNSSFFIFWDEVHPSIHVLLSLT